MVAVRGFHRFCLREGLTAVDPAAAVKPPAPPQRLPKALSVDEVTRILTAAAGAEAEPAVLATRDAALLEFLYGTGARISEAVGLDVDELDLETGAVLLRGKGSKERVVPVGSYARDALSAYQVRGRPDLVAAGRGTPALFLNARGGRLSRQSAWTVLRRAAAAGRDHQGDLAAHPAALVRHPPPGRRRRRPRRPGAARATLGDDDAGLHPGDGRQTPRGLRNRSSPRPLRLTRTATTDQPPRRRRAHAPPVPQSGWFVALVSAGRPPS